MKEYILKGQGSKNMENCFKLPIELIKLSNVDNFVKLDELRYKENFSVMKYYEKFGLKVNQENLHGLYAFWYIGNELPITKKVEIKIREEHLPLLIEWNKNDFFRHQPLYIGKTTNLTQRISQHLLATKNNYKDLFENGKFKAGRINKHNSSCQFRAGFEHLFGGEKNMNYCFENVALSFVEIKNGEQNEGVKNRFYLEDLAIGVFRPWFNVDSER